MVADSRGLAGSRWGEPVRSQSAADHRRHGGRAPCGPQRLHAGSLARQDAGRSSPGQQEGAHRLGDDDDEAELPESCRRLIGRRVAGSYRECGQDGRKGKGRRSMRRDRENHLMTDERASSGMRSGPGPRFSIHVRGVESAAS